MKIIQTAYELQELQVKQALRGAPIDPYHAILVRFRVLDSVPEC